MKLNSCQLSIESRILTLYNITFYPYTILASKPGFLWEQIRKYANRWQRFVRNLKKRAWKSVNIHSKTASASIIASVFPTNHLFASAASPWCRPDQPGWKFSLIIFFCTNLCSDVIVVVFIEKSLTEMSFCPFFTCTRQQARALVQSSRRLEKIIVYSHYSSILKLARIIT